jgi:hypothetical protein
MVFKKQDRTVRSSSSIKGQFKGRLFPAQRRQFKLEFRSLAM